MILYRVVVTLYLCAAAVGCGQSASRDPRLDSGGTGNATSESGGSAVSSAGSSAIAGASASAGGSGGVSTISAAGALGEGGAPTTPGDTSGLSELESILDDYRSFAPQTPEPVSVSGYIFGLCRSPTLRETEFLNSIHGDERYLQDWANPLAAQALVGEEPMTFPEGAIIVKEKYAGPKALKPDLVAIGLMIKRAPGFDGAHGDWDYAYYEPALGIVQTKEQSVYCANCHAGAAATDFVYVDGLKP